MADMFSLNLADQKKLFETFKAAPKKFQRATAGFINTYAFKGRKDQIASIKNRMVVRNDRFLSSRIRVNRANPTEPINTMAADLGSIRGRNFSGWISQETGRGDERKRTITDVARDGDFKKQIPRKHRINSKFHRVGEFRTGRHKKHGQALTSMIIASRQGKLKRPFIIKIKGPGKLSNLKRGVYGKQGNKIARLQGFERPNKPKINRWHTRGIEATRKRLNKKRIWGEQLARAFKFKI